MEEAGIEYRERGRNGGKQAIVSNKRRRITRGFCPPSKGIISGKEDRRKSRIAKCFAGSCIS
jgi:hypothetical protein